MYTKNPSCENVLTRPLGTHMVVPRGMTPFSSSGPILWRCQTLFTPPMSTDCQKMISFTYSTSFAKQDSCSFRAGKLGRMYGPSLPPFSIVSTGQLQQPFMIQVPPSCSSSLEQIMLPPTGFLPTSTTSFH
ncbi:hypothetical protein ACH5RR_028061 [Cinchona calisaya]|uniref:Uncharacterized protein n=1 Tax=Cinchona calisaya TaxID=153742 RepID=A0ABD2YRP0_9GENT